VDSVFFQLCYPKGVMMKEQRARVCALLLLGLCVSTSRAHDEGPLTLSLEYVHQTFLTMMSLSPLFLLSCVVPVRAFPLSQPSCVALLIRMGMSSILHLLAPVVSEPVISGDATCSPVSAVDFVCKSPRQFQPVGHSWSIFLNGTMYATSSIYFKWLSSYSPIFKRTCHHLFLEAK